MIVDLRGNCGGHISELLLAKLAQRPLAFDVPRRGAPSPYPSHAAGFVVTLVDRDTGSDAELAAHAFRDAGLGPIVGTRTWGGLLTVAGGSTSLVDGGYVSFPSQNVVAFEGGALSGTRLRGPGNAVENRGVEPDVVVTASPSEHRAGEDPQIDAATREALALLRRRRADISSKEKEKEDDNEDEKTPAGFLARARPSGGGGPANVVQGQPILRKRCSSGGGGGVSKPSKPGGKPETRVPSWPFRVFAPYPEAFDSESDLFSSFESDLPSHEASRKPLGRKGTPTPTIAGTRRSLRFTQHRRVNELLASYVRHTPSRFYKIKSYTFLLSRTLVVDDPAQRPRARARRRARRGARVSPAIPLLSAYFRLSAFRRSVARRASSRDAYADAASVVEKKGSSGHASRLSASGTRFSKSNASFVFS